MNNQDNSINNSSFINPNAETSIINRQSHNQRRQDNQSWLLNRSLFQAPNANQGNQSYISENNHQASGGFIWGTKFSIEEGKRKLQNFITTFNPQNYKLEEHRNLSFYLDKLLMIKETSSFYLVISAEDLYQYDIEMYYYLIKYPAETILLFDQIVNKIFIQNILSENE